MDDQTNVARSNEKTNREPTRQQANLGGTPKKNGWGCAARFPKPLPYLCRQSAIFNTLFMTWP